MSLVQIMVRRKHGGFFSFGMPLFVVWLFFLPAGLLVLPLILVACVAQRMNPWRTVSACWRVLAALRGTDVEFEVGNRCVMVEIA
jgi:hypothetical protein